MKRSFIKIWSLGQSSKFCQNSIARRFLSSSNNNNETMSKITQCNSDKPPKPVSPTFPLNDPASPPMLATPLNEVPATFAHRISYPKNASTCMESEAQVTTLENGLRVATQNTFGQFCTVGVMVDAGSRYEVNFPSGISHFLEKLAFQGTPTYPNRDSVLRTLEKIGGICDAQAGRDVIIYGTSADVRGLDTAVDVLSDCVLRPMIDDAEVNAARQAVSAELETLEMSPSHDTKLAEWAHQTAYSNNTLGLPRICPAENVEAIDRKVLLNYLNSYYSPKRMVLCGVGVEHARLVDLAHKCFVEKRPSWQEEAELKLLNPKQYEPDDSVAQYTGGQKKIVKDLSNISLGPNPLPNLAHLVLAFESVAHSDPENFVPICVLASLMGGGGSFSAGGPGKGMYSRLYLNVLNRYHWVHHAQAINISYSDTGLFYFMASADPQNLNTLVDVMVKELLGMASPRYQEVEVSRAKAQLQSLLLMNLEQRPVTFEDVGRQVLFHGKRRSPKAYYDAIGRVTAEDLHRVADQLLNAKLTYVGFGDLTRLPEYAKVQKVIADRASIFKTARQKNVFRFFG